MDKNKETIIEDQEEKTSKVPKKEKKRKSRSNSKDDKINQLENELAEVKDKHLRLFAEFENFKKRSIKEKIERMKTASQDTISVLLPVLDDFERAKLSAEDDNSTESFSDGVYLVYNKLNKALESKGLKVMVTNGEEFNSEVHEAISEIEVSNKKMKGKIIDTIERGYTLNDKIIRYPKVVVGK